MNIMTGCDYVITGVLRNGKRFKPIRTKTPWHYNIYKGTVWILIGDKRIKYYSIWN